MDITAAGLRQMLLQFDGGRVIVALTRPRDRRRSAETSESGLVLLNSLRRQADLQGLEVAVVTRNERVRNQAADVGIPVFGTVSGARQQPWTLASSRLEAMPPRPRRRMTEPVSVQRRGRLAARFRTVKLAQGDVRPLPPLLETLSLAAVFVLASLILIGFVSFILPVATVRLKPAQEPLTETVFLTARSDVETADPAAKLLPARRVGQKVEVEGTIPATGTVFAPDQPAQGTVIFSNRRPESQQIPLGTVVVTSTGSNVRFETTQPALLPGGVGAQVAVAIRALEPGMTGNVPAFTINSAEGSVGITTNVVNTSATWGGSVKEAPMVKQEDKDALRAQLLAQAKQKAYTALGELLDEGEFVPPETVGNLVLDETYDRFADEAADTVTLRLRLLTTGLAVDGNTANEIALQALSAKLSRRVRLASEDVTYTHGEAVVTEEGDAVVITFSDTASSIVAVDIDPAGVRASIRGLPADQAKQTLQTNWRLQAPPELTLGPNWLLPILDKFDFSWLPFRVAGRVPWLPFRTHVVVEAES